MNDEMNVDEIKYCKKCGCELMSTNNYGMCDNCKGKSANKKKKGVLAALSIAGAAVAFAKHNSKS